MILSTACGITPEGTCRRWSKEEREKVDVPQPHCIKIYNKNMGGVDLADRYVSYYRTKIRTKKWTIRVFSHFLDLAVENAWIEYRNDCKLMDVAAKNILDQFEFKNRVAETLIRAHVDEMQEAVNEVEQDLEIGETAALPKRTKVTSMPPTAICGIEFCVLGAMAPLSVPSREPGGVKKRGKYMTLTMEKKAAIIKLIESGRSQLDVAG
ncbi:hypothetical protein MRX96_023606 [Rhipicephalus microplus]